MMNRSATFVAITLVSLVATPLVVRAAGSGASASAVPVKVATIAAPGETATAAIVAAVDQSAPAAPCVKRVRVVYQGYGPAPDACAGGR